MPIYEYECTAHGRFDTLRGFAESSAPADCPVCAVACERVVSLPRIPTMDRGLVKAHDRNEKSRHEPGVYKGNLQEHAVFKGKARRGHVCSSSCTHGGSQAQAAEERKSQSLTTYNGPRPWVIEHTQGATVG